MVVFAWASYGARLAVSQSVLVRLDHNRILENIYFTQKDIPNFTLVSFEQYITFKGYCPQTVKGNIFVRIPIMRSYDTANVLFYLPLALTLSKFFRKCLEELRKLNK